MAGILQQKEGKIPQGRGGMAEVSEVSQTQTNGPDFSRVACLEM